MKVSLAVSILILAGLSACSFQSDKTDPGEDTITPVISSSQASFAIANQYLFAKSCNGCHNSTDHQGGVILDEYANVSALIEKIKIQIDNGKMPKSPVPPLSQKQKDLFQVWYAAGHPQTAVGEAPAPITSPVEPNFPSIAKKILSVKCGNCHNEIDSARGILLDTVEQLTCIFPPLVIPGNDTRGDFLKMINPAAPRMPPKRAQIPPVTQQEYDTIKEWIRNGALAGSGETAHAVTCPPLPPLPEKVPLEPKFASIKRDIFEQKCTFCHSDAGRMPDMPLAKPEDLLGGEKPLVKPGDPKSKLLAVFMPGARHPMPPPDNGIEPLTPEEIATVQEWIKNGATD